MGYFCLKCGEIYRNNIKNTEIKFKENDNTEDYIFCPKLKCIGQVIEVDDLFLPIIKLLNQKGYFTTYCCSGHIGDMEDSYISFDKSILGLPSIPEGYKEEKDSGKICIRKKYDINLNDVEFHKQLLQNAMETLQWAESLNNLRSDYLYNILLK